MKKLRFVAGLLALALFVVGAAVAPCRASDLGDIQVPIPLTANETASSTSYTFCSSTGLGDQVISGARLRAVKIQTTGSSTSVTATTATTKPFAGIVAGDILVLNVTGTYTYREVAAKADDDNITVDRAIDLSTAQTFGWRRRACGTTAADGWVPVRGISDGNFQLQIDSNAALVGGIDYKIECRIKGPIDPVAPTIIVGPTNITTASIPISKGNVWSEFWDECRLGFKVGASGTANLGVTLGARRAW